MGRNASKVYVEPGDIIRLERLVTELPSQAQVRVVLCNGDVFSGTVSGRPALQLFEAHAAWKASMPSCAWTLHTRPPDRHRCAGVGLEQRACECYAVVCAEYERLLPAPSDTSPGS